jgi:hypothetical protein
MTATEASDVLDDLLSLDGEWAATYELHKALEAIVQRTGTKHAAGDCRCSRFQWCDK